MQVGSSSDPYIQEKSRQLAANIAARKDSPESLLELFKDKIKARGTRGIIGLKRLFHIMDDDGSATLSLPEFIKVCKDYRVTISEENVPTLFQYFDVNSDGTINHNEFMTALKGDFPSARAATAAKAFESLALKFGQDGKVPKDKLLASFDVTRHPDVIQGIRTE